MMHKQLLIDTHVLLWSLIEPDRLGKQTRQYLLEADTVFVSIASAWEIILKERAGKLILPEPISRGIDRAGFRTLPVTMAHLEMTSRVNLPHKDPFDFLLIAQSIAENLIFVTVDQYLLTQPGTLNARL